MCRNAQRQPILATRAESSQSISSDKQTSVLQSTDPILGLVSLSTAFHPLPDVPDLGT